LIRPEVLTDRYWEAIEGHEARLDRARAAGDLSAVMGAAKDLCECVARVVCAEQAEQAGTADDFGQVISRAHLALDRRPGHGAATERSVRNIAQAARTLASEVNSLRNEVGTGHGRPVAPVVTGEMAALSEHAARLWAAWALARLDAVLRGEVSGLIKELQSGGGWHRGLLAQRFREVGLSSLHSEDQHRLGVAVARRSNGGTFVIFEAGVKPLGWDTESWPPNYRSGVAAGLLIDDEGRLALTGMFLKELAAIVAAMDLDEWRSLASQAIAALWTQGLASDTQRQQTLAEQLTALGASLDSDHRSAWLVLAEVLRCGGPATTSR
jgi:hypothetical protein